MKLLLAMAAILMSSTIFQFSCRHRAPIISPKEGLPPIVISLRESKITVIPAASSMPAHILFTKKDRYRIASGNRQPFKKEISLNPLMHDAKLRAELMVGNKIVKVYEATKSFQTALSNKETTWSPGRAKLSIMIPHVAADQEVVVTTSYAWMDPRWTWPIYLEGVEPTLSSILSVDVPFGVVMHHKAAKDKAAISLIPKDEDQNMGTRYTFKISTEDFSTKNPSERCQVYFSFELANQSERTPSFNNWAHVSSYLYDRLDRYDLPSAQIRDFTAKELPKNLDDQAKISRILSFLEQEIEKKASPDSFMEQELQPAQNTFASRFGSPFDAVILGKAMLNSIGFDAEMLAVAMPEQNPRIDDFFSPSLFSKVILLIKHKGSNLYWDPNESSLKLNRVPIALQGQGALVLRKEKGIYLKLPYLAPEENESRFDYDLILDSSGNLQGSFSLDLFRLKAERIDAILAEQESALSAKELQTQINAGDDALLWQSASMLKQKDQSKINISGNVIASIAINFDATASVAIGEILKPALLPLLIASKQNIASNTSVQARIKLPADHDIKELPPSMHFNAPGLFGQFTVSLEKDILIISGYSSISLPNEKNIALTAEQYEKLQSLKDQRLSILMNNKNQS